ncbi:hypothetical protein [Solibacillus sp. FSL K6-1554]|uniref:hypothetical protein n=1 Tax=Solibacillus sp. FSL K6-1554 TaxID=2921472 RepID=UPI0030F86154
MKKNILRNESGYTLVIVLLIITLFTVFTLSFMGISANTTKQNEVVERNIQSVTLAEMGITYFQQAISNSFVTHKSGVINNIKSQRNIDITNNTLKTDGHYINLAITLMKNELDNTINSISHTIQINSKPSSQFTITPAINSNFYINKTNGFVISFISIGTENGKQASIEGKMEFDFSKVFLPSPPSSEDNTFTPILQNNLIVDPGHLQNCPNFNNKFEFYEISCQTTGSITYHQNDGLSFEKSLYKVTGSLTTGNMNKDIINSTLYIVGSMTGGNMNSLNFSNIHVGGSLSGLNFNGNGFNHSKLQVLGAASIGNSKLNNSQIYIGGSASFGNINGIEESTIFINSSATIGGVDFGKNATICVNGPLTIGHINNNSNGTSNIYAKSSTNSKVITDTLKFNNACSKSNQQSNTQGGDIKYKTIFNYIY